MSPVACVRYRVAANLLDRDNFDRSEDPFGVSGVKGGVVGGTGSDIAGVGDGLA